MGFQGKIALVIPVKDEENSIGVLLDSLWEQTRQPDEIIITDGGSTDRTTEIIESHIKKGEPIKLIKSAGAYPGKGRNIAIESSSSDWIALTDAGIRLDRNWLAGLIEPLRDRRDLDGVYGNYEPAVNSFFKECLAIVFVPPPKLTKGKKMRSHFIASSMMKKDVWRAVGGFPDFRAAEDRIFMESVDREGFRMGFSIDAKVLWDIPSDFKTTFKRFSLFSMHDIKAGRFMDWHRGVIFMYLWGIILFLLGMFVSPLFYFIVILSIFLRSSNLMREKLQGSRLPLGPYLKKLALVTVIMIWIDLAMFWGTIEYLASKLKREDRMSEGV
jgi:glycosyltransferase involved in cell wall biosynthesis